MAETPLGQVFLKNVRLSFADIFKPGKPQKNDKGEMVPGKFKANGLMLKTDPDTKTNLAKIKKASEQIKEDKWGKPEKWPKLKAEKVCLRDGDQEDWDGYDGCWYISANNQNQPVLVDKDRTVLTLANDGPKKLYSGAYVNMIVRLWAQDSAEYGKRINASLEAIQFVKHGEPFSGAKPVDPNEVFEDIDDVDEIGGDDSGDDEDLI